METVIDYQPSVSNAGRLSPLVDTANEKLDLVNDFRSLVGFVIMNGSQMKKSVPANNQSSMSSA